VRAPDLYVTLGVPRQATPQEIRRQYFARAQTEHPDKGGNLASWQHVSNAYSTLIDAERRSAYDRSIATDDILDLLRGADLSEDLEVPFLVALRGGVVTHGGCRVRIPAQAALNGLILRLRGRGAAGFPPGDLFLTIKVAADPHLQLDTEHALGLRLRVPVTLLEVYQGGPLPVPTPWGSFYLRFGAGELVHGEEIVLTGYGVRCGCPAVPRCACEHGDLRIVISVQLPRPDLALSHVLERLQGAQQVRVSLTAAFKEE